MEKKILVAVDDSRHSENALRYAAGMAATIPGMKLVLFHVQPTISQYLVDEARTKPKARAQLERLMRRSDEVARTMLDRYKSQLVNRGLAESAVQAVTLPRRSGVAKDVLEYSTAMLYDAILIGRRGLSGLAEMFVGSVSVNIVDNSELIPVWLVDGKPASPAVMVAVDGSESSMRAVDHMAFIFGNSPDVAITFYHVAPRLKDFCPVDFSDAETDALEAVIHEGDQACIDQFYAHARRKLSEAGIQENQITVRTRQGGLRIGKAILDEFRKGGFGTLVVGRRGMGKKFFTGSVSRYLMNQLDSGALWVVP